MKTGIDLMIEALNKPKPSENQKMLRDLNEFLREYEEFKESQKDQYDSDWRRDAAFFEGADHDWILRALKSYAELLEKQVD